VRYTRYIPVNKMRFLPPKLMRKVDKTNHISSGDKYRQFWREG
jgi:hypothetical protein